MNTKQVKLISISILILANAISLIWALQISSANLYLRGIEIIPGITLFILLILWIIYFVTCKD